MPIKEGTGTWKCRQCGMKLDDRISIGDHQESHHGIVYAPRQAVSIGDGGPKEAFEAPPAAPTQPTGPYIWMGAWVLAEQVPIVVKAFKEARA